MRFGLVGTGHWARSTHAAGLHGHSGVDFAGVWGRSEPAVLAAEFDTAAYASFDALLDDVDAVAFAVPPHVQAGLALRAAHRGRHLLLDKPMALDVASAQRLTDAVHEAEVGAAVFFTLLYEPSVATWLADRSGAAWTAARIRMYSALFEPGNPYAESRWRREHGALWDLGPHAMSIAIRALGPVDSVVARRGFDDAIDLITRHYGGATATMSLSLTAPPAAAGNDWTFYGPAGTEAMPVPAITGPAAYQACVDDLIRSVHDNTATRCPVDLGSSVVRALATAQRAAESSSPLRPGSSASAG